jgi:hypothetical protein
VGENNKLGDGSYDSGQLFIGNLVNNDSTKFNVTFSSVDSITQIFYYIDFQGSYTISTGIDFEIDP